MRCMREVPAITLKMLGTDLKIIFLVFSQAAEHVRLNQKLLRVNC